MGQTSDPSDASFTPSSTSCPHLPPQNPLVLSVPSPNPPPKSTHPPPQIQRLLHLPSNPLILSLRASMYADNGILFLVPVGQQLHAVQEILGYLGVDGRHRQAASLPHYGPPMQVLGALVLTRQHVDFRVEKHPYFIR